MRGAQRVDIWVEVSYRILPSPKDVLVSLAPIHNCLVQIAVQLGSAVGLPPIGKLVAALIILCPFGVLQDIGSNVVGSTSIPSVVVQS
jgi:hypothetical protein